MKVTVKDFCKGFLGFYNDCNYKYEKKLNNLSYRMKQYGEHLSSYGVKKVGYNKYEVRVNYCYAGLYKEPLFDDTVLTVKRVDGVLINSGYTKTGLFPDSDLLFHGCYDEIDDICKFIEEYSSCFSKTYKLDDGWEFSVNANKYRVEFELSKEYDLYSVKRIVISKDNDWVPVFKGYRHDKIASVQVELDNNIANYLVDVTELEFMFTEPKKSEKKSWFSRLFG